MIIKGRNNYEVEFEVNKDDLIEGFDERTLAHMVLLNEEFINEDILLDRSISLYKNEIKKLKQQKVEKLLKIEQLCKKLRQSNIKIIDTSTDYVANTFLSPIHKSINDYLSNLFKEVESEYDNLIRFNKTRVKELESKRNAS